MTERWEPMVPDAPAPDGTLEVRAPYDRAVIGRVDRGGADVVERALETAHALFRDRDAWLPAGRRVEILRRAAALMEERREELALGAAREGGKPLADSLVEADRAIDGVHSCAEHLRTRHGEEVPMALNERSAHKLAYTRHEPIGPVVAFSAFNHPLNLIVHQVGPAVAAGCPCIVKPAEATPLSAFRFVGILREAGLPPEWCQALLTSDLELATEMATDPRVGFFSFVGSAEVGWTLRSKLAPGTRCALEHGGVAPVIVAADADLERAVPALTRAAFYHAGQVCVSAQRIYADADVAPKLAERLTEAAGDMAVGDPTEPATEVGPMIRPDEVERVDGWVGEAVESGAELLGGGETLGETCYAPTVLYDPPDDARVSREEVFGPVVSVYPYGQMDDALERANALPWAFQAAVFSRDLDTSMRAARRLDAAAVMVNEHPAFRVDWMPFAGLRQSGLGTGGIPHTMAEMQVRKMTVVHSDELEA